MSKKCFIIQPFDGGKFDKRYTDIFEPAVKDANLIPYRVDNDPATSVIIEKIEEQIQSSDICLAEISTDNPNVWYELGYALARGKKIVLVSEKKRITKLPFDIQHRQVLTYGSDSIRDFERLKKNITKKLIAQIALVETVKNIKIETPVRTDESGLEQHEFAALAIITGNQLAPEESVSLYSVKNDMNKAGFTDTAASIAIRSLKYKGYIDTSSEFDDYSHESYTACRLSETGEKWVIENYRKFNLRNNVNNSDDANDLFVSDGLE